VTITELEKKKENKTLLRGLDWKEKELWIMKQSRCCTCFQSSFKAQKEPEEQFTQGF